MLSAVNISGNRVHFSTFRLIDPAAFAEEDKRTGVQPGDVLLTIVGAIGRAAVVSASSPRFTLQRSVAVLSPIIIDPKFLMYQIEAPRLSRHLEANARGTAQKGVYLGTLGELEVWLPPFAEQGRIVAKVEELFSELDKGIESLTAARAQLKAYRQALLKHAFEGKLTADWRSQNPSAESGASLRQKVLAHRRKEWEIAEFDRLQEEGRSPKDDKWKRRYPAARIPGVQRSFSTDTNRHRRVD
jgi:type I restriction enzyme S subunit